MMKFICQTKLKCVLVLNFHDKLHVFLQNINFNLLLQHKD